jgi:hypothetical protein
MLGSESESVDRRLGISALSDFVFTSQADMINSDPNLHGLFLVTVSPTGTVLCCVYETRKIY